MSKGHEFTNVHGLTLMVDTIKGTFRINTLLLFTVKLKDDSQMFLDIFRIFFVIYLRILLYLLIWIGIMAKINRLTDCLLILIRFFMS